MKHIIRLILSIAMIAAWCTQAGCGSSTTAPDAGIAHVGPSTGFGGPIAPQGGTITQVIAGTCMTGGGASGHVTLGADTTCVQSRVTGTCTTGQAMTGVNADGTVVCSTISSISGLTTGDLTVATSSTTIGPFGGSTPSACAAGAITTQPTLGPNGVLVNNCSNLVGVANASGGGVATKFLSGNGTWTSLSSNLRVSGTSIDLSTAVTMPGSLAVKGLAGTAQAVSTSGNTDDVALASNTTAINYTGTADATWGGFVNTGERWIYVQNATSHVLTLADEDTSTTAADRIKTPETGSDGFSLPPNSGTWVHYDTVTSRWNLSGLVATTCSAGQFVQAINPDGTAFCAAPTSSGISGSGTTGDLMKWTGSTAAGNYAGSTASACASGSVVTDAALSAAGVLSLTCGVTPITGTLTTGLFPYATSAGTVADSDFFEGATFEVAQFSNAGGGMILGFQSLSAGYNVNTNGAVLHFNTVGYHAGTTWSRDDEFDDGKGTGSGHEIAYFSGATKSVEFFGPASIDGAPTLGTSWSNTTTNNGQPKCSGTTTTVTGSGATIVGTNCSGIVTLSSAISTFTLNFDASHPWSNTPPCVFEYVASGSDVHWVSAQSTTAVTVHFASATTGSVNYQCGWGY